MKTMKHETWLATFGSACGIWMLVVVTSMFLWHGRVPAAEPKVVGSLVIKLIDEVQVPALEQGALQAFQFQLGDSVKAGQLLTRVDDSASVTQRDLAALELEVSQHKIENYRGKEISTTDLNESKASLSQQELLAEISAEKAMSAVRVSAAEKAEAVAKNEWQRAEQAHKKYAESVSQSELENLRLKYEHARFERIQAQFEQQIDQLVEQSDSQGVKVAQLAVERAELKRDSSVADTKLLELDVKAKATTLRLRELMVNQHQILAPINGTIVEIFKRRGEWVQPGDSVMRIINLDTLHAEGFLTGPIRPQRGQRVRLVLDDRTAEGTIDFVSSEQDQVSGEYRFLVRLSGGTFQPGERVDIEW